MHDQSRTWATRHELGQRFASSKELFTTSSLGLFKYGSMAWKESHPPTDITTRGFI